MPVIDTRELRRITASGSAADQCQRLYELLDDVEQRTAAGRREDAEQELMRVAHILGYDHTDSAEDFDVLGVIGDMVSSNITLAEKAARQLRAPFADTDEIPGTIADALRTLDIITGGERAPAGS